MFYLYVFSGTCFSTELHCTFKEKLPLANLKQDIYTRLKATYEHCNKVNFGDSFHCVSIISITQLQDIIVVVEVI